MIKCTAVTSVNAAPLMVPLLSINPTFVACVVARMPASAVAVAFSNLPLVRMVPVASDMLVSCMPLVVLEDGTPCVVEICCDESPGEGNVGPIPSGNNGVLVVLLTFVVVRDPSIDLFPWTLVGIARSCVVIDLESLPLTAVDGTALT